MIKDINISNILSLFRLAIGPIIMFLVIFDESYSALILFVLAVFTDFLDGYLSRRLKEETKIGYVLDKVADKSLIGFIVLGFIIKFNALKWLFVLIPIIIIYIVVFFFFVKHKQQASLLGRISIPLQALAVTAYMLNFKYRAYLLWAVVVLTAYVGFSYMYRILKKVYTKK
jgi:phosphatidylglycerophosphate synthase